MLSNRFALMAIAVLLGAPDALAQGHISGIAAAGNLDMEEITPLRIGQQWVHSAVFACGTIPSRVWVPPPRGLGNHAHDLTTSTPTPVLQNSPAPAAAGLPVGDYATQLTVHNPNPNPVTFTIRVTVGGVPGAPVLHTLEPDGVAVVGCIEMAPIAQPTGFVEGVVIVRTGPRLIVNALYTFKEKDLLLDTGFGVPVFVVPSPHDESPQ